jgi:hypothetical protein
MTQTSGTQAPPAKPRWWVGFWRWLASLDLTKPPAPVLRWLGILLIGIVYVAVGAPEQLGDWLWFAILGGALIFPDVAGFAIGGFRVDLQQAQEEIASLRLRLDIRQQVINNISAQSTQAEVGENTPRQQRVIEPGDEPGGEGGGEPGGEGGPGGGGGGGGFIGDVWL